MNQASIKSLIESRSSAIRAKNISKLMEHYSANIIYFDVVPPLQYVGTTALHGRFTNWFDGYEGEIRQEIRGLHIWEDGDTASASMLIRSGGILKNGKEVSLWVRTSNSFQRIEGKWLITHEHVSVPADLKSGAAVTNIEP